MFLHLPLKTRFQASVAALGTPGPDLLSTPGPKMLHHLPNSKIPLIRNPGPRGAQRELFLDGHEVQDTSHWPREGC